jgi:ABC-type uncharacterized transport system auxiliary subunit
MSKSGKTTAAFIALGLAIFLLAGCGAARPSKYYGLTVPGDSSANSADLNAFPVMLLIGRITGPELYREDPIVYSSNGDIMGTYEYHRWVEPPTQLLQEILLRELRASGHFRVVELLRSDIHGDYLLHGHLYDFKELDKPSMATRFTLELELLNIKTGATVWTHFYTHDEPTNGKEVGAVVEALDKSVQQGIREFSSSLTEYFTAHPPRQSAP